MSDKPLKRYIFASDFDQTLTFNDSGYVLSEMLGIPTDEFERKARGMAKLNLVQQGAELAYLLLHDPEFNSKVRKQHLYEVGKQIRLKQNIKLLYELLDGSIEGCHFDFYVLSASPVEVVHSALDGLVPKEHIFGTQFVYDANGRIERLERATAGYGKVAVLDQLQTTLQIAPDHIVYCRRWQLGHPRHVARQHARRFHHCGVGGQARGAHCQANIAEQQRRRGAGADS